MVETILVVDDEPDVVDLVRYHLHRANFDVLVAFTGPTGLAAATESRPDAISARLKQEAGTQGQQRLIEYGIGAQILLDLGVHEMVLLSNSPARKIVGLEGYGLRVAGHRSLE